MPGITIDGKQFEFKQGQMILEVANENDIEIPHYCYHPSLSIVASCRICLAEVWAPNPRNDGKLEPMPKLLPTCKTPAGDGQVVYTTSPKATANQKAVMEFYLNHHPIDCPICDQAGECTLQDYAYEYGRGQRRCDIERITQSKKDVGNHVMLYGDRCIMCTLCVRFTSEITGTSELYIDGRDAGECIDVFPGKGINNELSANVIDLCPVGALLDKDFMFQQRVWLLQGSPSIDPTVIPWTGADWRFAGQQSSPSPSVHSKCKRMYSASVSCNVGGIGSTGSSKATFESCIGNRKCAAT